MAYMSYKDNFGTWTTTNTVLVDDTLMRAPGAEKRFAFETDSVSGLGLFRNDRTPFYLALMYDISRDHKGALDIDSVTNDVLNTSCVTMMGGSDSLIKYDFGDLDTNGYNEAEGCWVLKAVNNSVRFKFDGKSKAHFQPAFKILNYLSPSKPQYVFMYRPDVASPRDTFRLLNGYGFTSVLNKNTNMLLMQLDTVIRDSAYIYISSDVTLAVEMGGFYGASGDGADTLHWRTESEEQNMGFNIYRRIRPAFLDSVIHAVENIGDDDSSLDNAGRLCKLRKITYNDTVWTRANRDMIPGAPQGVSYGTRQYREIDYFVQNDVCYEYQLEAVDYKNGSKYYGPVRVVPRAQMPTAFALHGNYPNPFSSLTTLRFDVPVAAKIQLDIYNLQGRLVARLIKPDKQWKPGYHKVVWNGRDDYNRALAAGPYIYRLSTKGFAKAKMMIKVR
jgi:hypothetical protein